MVDQVSLSLHVLAAIGLVGGAVAQVMVGMRLRAATTTLSIATWAGFARSLGTLVLVSGVVSMLTGGHLAGAVWSTEEVSGFARPWITLGLVGLVLAGAVWGLGATRLRRLVDKAHGDDPAARSPGDARSRAARLAVDVRSSALWGPVHGLVGIGVGLVWIMTTKPDDWLATAVVLVGSLVLGWIAGLLVSTRA